jgi:hypothetical protein
MRQLRFLRQGEDPDHAVCESADGGEQFLLLIDRAMRDALRADLPRLPHAEPEREAPISPREIQMRVRAGESPEDLAADADMPLERVMRFAAAVLQERARIADTARHSRARRPSGDGQPVEFGPTVDARFEAHGIDSAAVQWGAYRDNDGQWVVVAQWMGGESERQAEWSFHLGTRTITPLDDAAGDLLSDKPVRALVTPPARDAESPVSFPAMPDARTGPLPHLETVFDQEADAAPEASGSATGRKATGPAGPQLRGPIFDAPGIPTSRLPASDARATGLQALGFEASGFEASGFEASGFEASGFEASGFEASGFDVPGFDVPGFEAPPLPLHVAGAPEPDAFAHLRPARREESDEQRAERARIPSWDDILLGVRRKQD